MFKKLLTILLSTALCFSFAACGTTPPENGKDPSGPGGENENPPQDNKEGTVDDLVINFWQSQTMYDESVLLVAETDGEGNVISAPKAKFLFDATEILSVKQYFHEDNGGKSVTYTAGEDYVYENGTLTAKGSIVENAITGKKEFSCSMPYVTDKALTGEATFPGLGSSTSIPSTDSGLYLPFTEGYQIVQMQLSVTYTHGGGWTGATPSYFGSDALSGTLAKLKNKEAVRLFVYGDSISTGANSSSVLGIAPFLATWPELVANNLSRYYGATVELTNRSVGGWTSSNGVGGGSGWVKGQAVRQEGLRTLLSTDLEGYVPDLVFLGFGMNDASLGIDLNTYLNNMKDMIDVLRSVNPDCEIVLVGTMLANPKALNQAKNQAEFTQYLSRLVRLYEGVCVVDVGAVHQSILDAGKRFTEISSNNVNHPNDFMARVYAMTLLSALIDTQSAS